MAVEKRPVCFLDIDGVLVTQTSYQLKDAGVSPNEFHPECVARLMEIWRRTWCWFVLSSEWRHDEATRRSVTEFMHAHGEKNFHLFDRTPRRFGQRGVEIEAWLYKYGDPPFVILDDEPGGIINYGGARLPEYIVTTDGIFGDGLTAENVEQAVAILERQKS